MGGKASGVLGIAIAIMGSVLIIAAVRGTYIPVWRAISGESPKQAAATGTNIGNAAGAASAGNTQVF